MKNKFAIKIFNFINTFIRPKTKYFWPKKSEILIYDIHSVDPLHEIIKDYSFEIISTRGEWINLPTLILALIDPKFWSGDAFQIYLSKYIYLVQPKVVLTFIDNDFRFYKISKRNPKVKTIFIQNGRRTQINDIFSDLKYSPDSHVDFMLVFGKFIGDHYKKYISGTAVPIGSFKNNLNYSTNVQIPNSVLFISNWERKPENHDQYIENSNREFISWDKYYEEEVSILHFLEIWCYQNNKLLLIAPRSKNNQSEELDFYKANLKKMSFNFITDLGIESTYESILATEIVVTMNSTCGYEALARGRKTAFFNTHMGTLGSESESFGWPANLPSDGLFWTHDNVLSKFERIMNYLNNISINDFLSATQEDIFNIIIFDPDNSKTKSILKELILGNGIK